MVTFKQAGDGTCFRVADCYHASIVYQVLFKFFDCDVLEEVFVEYVLGTLVEVAELIFVHFVEGYGLCPFSYEGAAGEFVFL